MAGLSVAERRRLAEIERDLRADERLTALLSNGFEIRGGRLSRRRGRDTGLALALPWILLVSWLVLGLLFGAVLSGATAPVLVAGAVVICALLLTVRRIRRGTRRGRAQGRARGGRA